MKSAILKSALDIRMKRVYIHFTIYKQWFTDKKYILHKLINMKEQDNKNSTNDF